MELFVLGLVFGAATAQGKAVTKAVAKGYMAVSDKTKEVVATLREDMQGAIDEARTERDQEEADPEVAGHDVEALALREETVPVEPTNSQVLVTASADVPAAAAAASPGKAKQSPSMMRILAKRYMVMTEKTRGAVSGMRENVRDAIEEARYERELAAQRGAAAPEADVAKEKQDVVELNAVEKEEEKPAVHEAMPDEAPRQKRAYATRSTRTEASGNKIATESPKAARSTRTKTASVKTAADTPASETVIDSATPAKRGRPKKAVVDPKLNTSDAMLEVAEIAADGR